MLYSYNKLSNKKDYYLKNHKRKHTEVTILYVKKKNM